MASKMACELRTTAARPRAAAIAHTATPAFTPRAVAIAAGRSYRSAFFVTSAMSAPGVSTTTRATARNGTSCMGAILPFVLAASRPADDRGGHPWHDSPLELPDLSIEGLPLYERMLTDP